MQSIGFPHLVERAAARAGLDAGLSRRGFLLLSACAAAFLAAPGLSEAFGADAPLLVLGNSRGILLADPVRCVGCQRCELACSEGNDGIAQPSRSRIKISRALNFGQEGPGQGPHGLWGDGLVVQGFCRQCPDPVPCATACPQGAIRAHPRTGARMVDGNRCVGCRECQAACPWGMMTFDEERGKADKCFLCDGRPKCVEACPSGALGYAPWRDLTAGAPASGRRRA